MAVKASFLSMGDCMSRNVVIAGAGPSGLTAAYELSAKSCGYTPVVLEETDSLGGIARTVVHNGNRMDIGGHRFFTKNERVKRLWNELLPVVDPGDGKDTSSSFDNRVMLRRHRVSRIYYLNRFFDYPVTLSYSTLSSLGLNNTIKVSLGFLISRLRSLPESSLENFYINRFGRPLYQMFFEDYTQKVWGRHPSEIGAEWGRQRVKGLSVMAIIKDMVSKKVGYNVSEKRIETSLIDYFIYPKLGPGQLWEIMAERAETNGAKILKGHRVNRVSIDRNRIRSITAVDKNGVDKEFPCDYFVSTMAIKDLIGMIDGIEIPRHIREIAENLPYRDFVTVGLLVDYMKLSDGRISRGKNGLISDNWIYIQDRGVKLGRVQIFNNWSPYLVADSDRVWIGLEFFCNEGDDMWEMSDNEFVSMAVHELSHIGLIDKDCVRDTKIVRMKKAYPAYFGSYSEFSKVRAFLDNIQNLFCIGRNGQHRYNNMDHSMLTAMMAADCIISGVGDKSDIWNVNTESDYHEAAKA